MIYHLIGAGGAGMSVVGQLLLERGHEVTGSDRAESANLARLRAAGARVWANHAAEHVPAEAVVVVSSAIRKDNPELAVARERGQEVIHRSEALARAAADKDFVAVAGAHGKTTTSAMLAVAFEALGRDPSRAIGATLAGGLSGAHLGTGSMFIAEADESDGSFLNYTPRVALVTNIEPDHLDHYGSEAAFHAAFDDFARRIKFGGLLICCADNPGARDLAARTREAGIRTWTYGTGEGLEHHAKIEFADPAENDATGGQTAKGECAGGESAEGECAERTGQRARITFRGKPLNLTLSVPGQHNMLNAVGALLAGIELGEDPTEMADALADFRGTGRRFELRGTKAGRRVIDDYAHHPTEVRATLETARAISDAGVRVLFQPHLYSRTEIFAEQFASALMLADSVVVTKVYPAREVPGDGRESDAITELLPGAELVADREEAARRIAELSESGDIVLTMGAGDVTELADVVLGAL